MVYEGVDYEGDIVKFLLVVGSFGAATHIYIATKIHAFYSLLNYWFLVLALVFLGISFPLFTYLERLTQDVKVRYVYFLSALWAGFSFITLNIFLLHEILNAITMLAAGISLYTGRIGAITIFAAIACFFYGVYNARVVKVREEKIFTDNINEEFDLVHLSDIHIGAINLKKTLKYVVDKVNSLENDIVLITGDVIDGSGVINEEVLSPLNEIEASNVYFCSGNHEIYFGLEEACDLIDDTKVTVLRGETETVNDIRISGLDNPNVESDNIEDIDIFDPDDETFNILMYHTPSGIDDFLESDFDLLLSGHTHNGQIYPFKYVVKLFHEFTYGLFKIGSQYINITSGAATWGPPVRVGTQNEIVEIKVRQKD